LNFAHVDLHEIESCQIELGKVVQCADWIL